VVQPGLSVRLGGRQEQHERGVVRYHRPRPAERGRGLHRPGRAWPTTCWRKCSRSIPTRPASARSIWPLPNLDLDLYELKGDVRLLKAQNAEKRQKLQLTGGDIRGVRRCCGTEKGIRERGENAVEFNTDGQMVNVDFAFSPVSGIDGQFSLNVLGERRRQAAAASSSTGSAACRLWWSVPTFDRMVSSRSARSSSTTVSASRSTTSTPSTKARTVRCRGLLPHATFPLGLRG
jgi:hypothetical protein